MTTLRDVEPEKLIRALSEEFKKMDELKPPEWAKFAKTGRHKEMPPMEKDWWYVRLGAILRAVSLNGPVGVQRLRSKYGGRKKFGQKPKRFVKASGNIIRKALQQLENAGLVMKKEKKGRIVTKKGQSLLDKTAANIIKGAKNESK